MLLCFALAAGATETGHLTINVDSYTEIYIDSVLVSNQSFDRLALATGTYRIQIQDIHDFNWNNRPIEETIQILPSSDLSLDYRKHNYAWIKSRPVGSDIYLGSIWLGKTPMIIRQETLTGQSVLLRKSGYNEKSFTLKQITDSDFLTLNKLNTGSDEAVFEASLGSNRVNWFRESFILTSFLSSWAGFLFKREADQNYAAYLSSSFPVMMDHYYSESQKFDRYSEIAIAVSVTSLSIYLLLLLTE